MTERTREQHLAWCKERAREYLDEGDVQNAVTSMMSDLQKHPDTKAVGNAMMGVAFDVILQRDVGNARRFIEGFR